MNLKKIRKEKRLTQLEASYYLHIPLRSYKRLENDSSYQKTDKYLFACHKLNEYISKDNIDVPSYKFTVVGAGYVGFSLAVLLSTKHQVTVVDINEDKVDKINQRIPLFKDKDIEYYLKNKNLNLKGSYIDIETYRESDFVIIALPTNYDEKNKTYDYESIMNTISDIRSANKDCLIIIKSTCHVGFTESLDDEDIIFSPEFLKEGQALKDNLSPSRIIIGGKKNKKTILFSNILLSLTINRPSVLFMTSKEAEAVKLFSNAYLALRVAYFNELDSFSNQYQLDSHNVVDGVSLDPRIGDYYNNPSFGYGGYCLPKDTDALISQMSVVSNNELLTSVKKSNQSRKEYIINDIASKLHRGSIIGVFSTESKKGSDNSRNASIIDVINGLEKLGFVILYNDNNISIDEFKKKSDLIITNRYDESLFDVMDKVYTRDLFTRD